MTYPVKDKHIDDWEHAAPGVTNLPKRENIYDLINDSLISAYEKHGCPRWGRHEALSIIREEFEEAWDVVKQDGPTEDLLEELLQVAAMVVRYIETEPSFEV